MTRSHNDSLEETRPQLVAGTEFIPFNRHVTYLKNAALGRFLKLTAAEAIRAREFDGTRTFSDILHRHVDTDGAGKLLNVAELLLYLKTRGFIVDGTSPDASAAAEEHRAVTTKSVIVGDLVTLPWKFKNPVLQKTAAFGASTTGLLFLALLPLLCLIMSADYRLLFFDFGGIPFRGGLSPAAIVMQYVSVIALLYVSCSMIVSLKNVLSAYALAGMGLQPLRPRIVFCSGFVYFDCTITDIVVHGAFATIRLYVFRLLIPLLLLHVVTAFGPMVAGMVVLMTFKKACIMVTALSLMPLVKTDLNNLLFLLTSSTSDFKQSLAYLGKKYFASVSHFSMKPGTGNDFCYIITLLSIVWLAITGKVLWGTITAVVFYVVDGFRYGFSPDSAFILLQVLSMLVPFIVLVGMALFVGASNVQHALRSPLHRLQMFAERLKKQRKPDVELVDSFVRQIPLFSTLSDVQRAALCARFGMVSCGPRHTVVLQGERGDTFYIIISGKLRVMIEDEFGVERTVAVLGVGDCFGEIALLENIPRTASVVSMTPATLLTLGKKDFDDVLAALPIERGRITDQIRHGRLLMSIPPFAHLSPEQLSTLISGSTVKKIRAGDTIFNQGDEGDCMYVIISGTVRIQRSDNGVTVMEKVLGSGEILGEIALVKHIPRTATATAETEVELLAVGKECFYDLIGKSLLTGAEIDRLADRRIAEFKAPVASAA